MMISEEIAAQRYNSLIQQGVLTGDQLAAAERSAAARGVDGERVLLEEYNVPRRALLEALSEYYGCPYIEYDERMPVPPELLMAVDGERLSVYKWFPVIKDGDTVVIAAGNPEDPALPDEIDKFFPGVRCEFRVALESDIQWFIQDFLHSKPGSLIGTERTGLAFWRNTMAQWRTRLACYRNDLAKARTDLALLRWGLGLIAISDTLMRTRRSGLESYSYWTILAAGLGFAVYGLRAYLKIRKSRMSPPGHHTLVEVTSATLQFLEAYHFMPQTGFRTETKKTMLGRLGDFLANHSTILYPSPASKERTHLARERNVLAGQRTVLACYRTIYARSRTGLAFIRTGVSFLSLGLGMVKYFGISVLTAFDALLVTAGFLMIIDGALWYFPVRQEQAELPRCPVSL